MAAGAAIPVLETRPETAAGGTHGFDHLVRPVPHLLLGNLDHLEAHFLQRRQPLRVVVPVDQRRVVALALHLDDERKVLVLEVDTRHPVIAAAVDLATHRRLARALQHGLEPALEVAVGRDIVVAPALEQLTHHAHSCTALDGELVECSP